VFKGFALGFLLIASNSCETTELEILENPNALTPAQADVDLFLNGIQRSTATFFEAVTEEGMEVTRILHMFGPNYNNAYSPDQLNFPYETVYSGIISDIRAMEPLALEKGLYTHIAIARVIEAYSIGTLVDFLGDIPYDEAVLGAENLNPKVQPGASVYEAVLALLDDAIVNFNKAEVSKPKDLFYGGNEAKWIKLTNTLKLKFLLQTRIVDTSVKDKINAIITSGNYITSTSDDFQFQYSSVDANPDSRHPIFSRNFNVAADVSDYMSNSFMYYLDAQKTNKDPRIRYYFYRQKNNFTTNANEASCIVDDKPSHYIGDYPFCNAGNGYWGRDHGDSDGIPPDGGKRTTWGVYPVGGLFDNNSFKAIPGRNIGLKGAGISPIMLASYVDFMLAESALTLNTTGSAKAYLEAGVRKSIDKVMNFGASVAAPAFIPTNVEAYITEVLARYDAAGNDDERLEVIVKEYFIALFGNGIEAYNTYRRTGHPSDLQPTLLAASGAYINSFFYPSSMVDRNSNISQKADQSTRVFWATGGPTVK
jgi:hypothetical protein